MHMQFSSTLSQIILLIQSVAEEHFLISFNIVLLLCDHKFNLVVVVTCTQVLQTPQIKSVYPILPKLGK